MCFRKWHQQESKPGNPRTCSPTATPTQQQYMVQKALREYHKPGRKLQYPKWAQNQTKSSIGKGKTSQSISSISAPPSSQHGSWSEGKAHHTTSPLQGKKRGDPQQPSFHRGVMRHWLPSYLMWALTENQHTLGARAPRRTEEGSAACGRARILVTLQQRPTRLTAAGRKCPASGSSHEVRG